MPLSSPTGPCRLLDGLFADFVQVTLGAVAVSVLLVKRKCERPRRRWRVWFMDVSKQVFGAGFAHILNLLLAALLTSVSSSCPDQCAFYFINFFADTTLGVVINWLLLRAQRRAAYKWSWESLKRSGDYGPRVSCKPWLLQLFAWMVIVAVTKAILGVGLALAVTPLSALGCWLASPFAGNPKVELVIVMLIIPYILNAVQFWVLDNILKRRERPATHSPRLVPSTPDEDDSLDGVMLLQRGGGGATPDDEGYEGVQSGSSGMAEEADRGLLGSPRLAPSASPHAATFTPPIVTHQRHTTDASD